MATFKIIMKSVQIRSTGGRGTAPAGWQGPVAPLGLLPSVAASSRTPFFPMLRLKLVHNSKGGASSQVVTVDGSLPLSALRAQAAKAFSLPAEGAQLLVGFPPEPLTDEADRPLSSLLTTGTVVEVRAGASLAMAKIAVEPNGNCLFASIGFLVAGECTPAAAALQRESVVAALLSEPDTYSDAVLGCARDDYIEMIGRNATWGGAIELGLLSKLHNLEVRTCCTPSSSACPTLQPFTYARLLSPFLPRFTPLRCARATCTSLGRAGATPALASCCTMACTMTLWLRRAAPRPGACLSPRTALQPWRARWRWQRRRAPRAPTATCRASPCAAACAAAPPRS